MLALAARAWTSVILVTGTSLCACSAGGGDAPGTQSHGSAGQSSGGSAGGGNSNDAGNASIAGGSGTMTSTGGGGSATGGSGGNSGSGGATGGNASAGGADGKTGCAQADILCLTFDDIQTGAMPQMAPFQMYNCAGQSTSTDLLVEEGKGVNGSKAFTSKKSLNGGCNLMADLGDHPELWVTAQVKFSAGVPVATVHELTPFELTKTATDDPGIRPGIRADNSCNSWQGAELNITGGGERTGCTAYKFNTEEWYCLEVQVKNLPAAVEGHLFIDSVEPGYHIHQDAVDSVVNMDWTGAKMLRLGARSYSASVDSPLYVDNLSVSTLRVGCKKP
jgi:hypothetical protein